MSFDLVAWLVLVFWIGFRLTAPFTTQAVSLAVSLGLVVICVMVPVVSHLMVAVLAPIGFLLPALAIRDVLGRTALKVAPFSVVDVVLIMCAMTWYIAASIGVFAFDPYRLGYTAVAPGVLAACCLVWALLRGHFIVAIAVIASQAAWGFGWSGPNFFDNLLHALIVPICFVWIVKRAITRAFQRA